MKARGFTLTEMLVVLAILGTLAGVGYPVTLSFIGKSRETACLQHLRSLGVAMQSHIQDHNNVIPDLETSRTSKSDTAPVLETVLLEYVDTEEAFRCPADSKQYAKTGSSYLFGNSQLGGKNVSEIANLTFFGIPVEKIPLIADKEAWHPSGTNSLYPDLSVSNKLRFTLGK